MTLPKRRADESEENYAIRLERAREACRIIGRQAKAKRRRGVPPGVVDLPGEEWRPVVGYEGRYEVSNQGRVKGLTREVWRCGHLRLIHGQLLSAHHHTAGYLVVDLRIANVRKTSYVHRLVLEAFVGPCPPDMECRHLNGIRDDARLVNLAWGTRQEQAEDKVRHGTQTFGDAHHNTKVLDVDVRRIRTLAANGVTCKVIGLTFEMHPSTVSQIVRRDKRRDT
jgi:hypothetical protein